MVKPRSIFIKHGGDEARVVQAIEGLLGQSLDTEILDVGAVHRGRAFDVEFVLFREHGLEDDGDIAFEEYTYQLQLVAFEAGLRMSAFPALYEGISLFLAERLCGLLGSETMAVENLQRKIAEFQP